MNSAYIRTALWDVKRFLAVHVLRIAAGAVVVAVIGALGVYYQYQSRLDTGLTMLTGPAPVTASTPVIPWPNLTPAPAAGQAGGTSPAGAAGPVPVSVSPTLVWPATNP